MDRANPATYNRFTITFEEEVAGWGKPDDELIFYFLAVAAVTDLKEERIDNLWILTGCGVCLWLRIAGLTQLSAGQMLAGFLLPLLAGGILFLTHMFGAGDLKLFMMLGLGLGIRNMCIVFIISMILAGGYSLVCLANRHDIIPVFSEFISYIQVLITKKELIPYPGIKDQRRRVHLAVFILPAYLILVFCI